MPAPMGLMGDESNTGAAPPVRDAWDKACVTTAQYDALLNAINNRDALGNVNPEAEARESARITEDLAACKEAGPPAGSTTKSIEDSVAPQRRAIQGYSNITVF